MWEWGVIIKGGGPEAKGPGKEYGRAFTGDPPARGLMQKGSSIMNGDCRIP